MNMYRHLDTKAEREDFVKRHATRWSELARLPYFDMCRMIVIDPMHNLFLGMCSAGETTFYVIYRPVFEGLVKTHFYHIWVQLKILRKSKELRRLHGILERVGACYRCSLQPVTSQFRSCLAYSACEAWTAAKADRGALWWLADS